MKTELEAVNGKKMQALEVFAHALRFFKQHAVQVGLPRGSCPPAAAPRGRGSTLPPQKERTQRWSPPPAASGPWPTALAGRPGRHRLLLARQELKDQCPSLPERDAIRWVITVPAIWKQPAKQFMREAAYKARGRARGGLGAIGLRL